MPRLLLLLCFLAPLAGCYNGLFLGLIPVGPFLDGKVEGDVYTSPDGSFSVAVPYAEGNYERTYMKAKEQFAALNAYVSFGPAAFDQSIYRLEIARRPTPESKTPELADAAGAIIEGYTAQLRAAFDSDLEVQIPLREETIQGRPAVYTQLGQVAPAGKFMSDTATPITHDVWVIGFPEGLACAWVQVAPEHTNDGMAPRAFAESVVVR